MELSCRVSIRVVLFVVCGLVLTFHTGRSSSAALECTLLRGQAPCICTMPNGSLIDMSPLAPNPIQSKLAGVYSYRYNPCRPFNWPETNGSAVGSQCTVANDGAVCQKDSGGAKPAYFFCGTTRSAIIYFNTSDGSWHAKYTHGQNAPRLGRQRTVDVKLTCDGSVKTGELEVIQQVGIDYYLELKSQYACIAVARPSHKPSGPSVGTVLLIIFFVLAVVYFVGGILFLRFARGATGAEMIPNISFWAALPGYIKEGAVFLFTPCCGSADRVHGYEKL